MNSQSHFARKLNIWVSIYAIEVCEEICRYTYVELILSGTLPVKADHTTLKDSLCVAIVEKKTNIFKRIFPEFMTTDQQAHFFALSYTAIQYEADEILDFTLQTGIKKNVYDGNCWNLLSDTLVELVQQSPTPNSSQIANIVISRFDQWQALNKDI